MQSQFDSPQWFVLRDLKRANSKSPAYKTLPELGFEVFTPMHWVLLDDAKGGKVRKFQPFISNLLFAKSLKSKLDEVISKTDTLQYRYVKGAPQNTPMVVPMADMDRFKSAVAASETCTYFAPEDITPDMLGKKVMIVGGALDGAVGNLLKKKGARKKRLLLQLRDVLIASVEIESGFIQFI